VKWESNIPCTAQRCLQGKFDLGLAARCRTIREFDAAITIHSFGWPDVDAYYAGSGSCLSIPNVTVPLLCIQAMDDPIAPAEAIPYQVLHETCYVSGFSVPGGFNAIAIVQPVKMHRDVPTSQRFAAHCDIPAIFQLSCSELTHTHEHARAHTQALSDNPNTVLVTTPCGGHLGW
jgi:predicted alpha/beta-fold hydrolase